MTRDTRHLIDGQIAVALAGGDVVNEMREGRVTVFSQMQRRNVSQHEFKAELWAIVSQEGLGDEVTAE